MEEIVERLYSQYLVSRRVTTDSRAISEGSIFFAFKGENFDGNAFAGEALRRGAALCVISDAEQAVNERCIVVDDVLAVLQALARRHRKSLTIPVVGITGTNGKTTTKELVREVLAQRYRVHATMGNHNNHLGVPLTILSMPADTEILVVEMGANHRGEIADLCSIALPSYGLITNIGRAHLEGFGSFEGVVETKTALYDSVAANEGTVFVNADDRLLIDKAAQACTLGGIRTALPAYMPDLPSAQTLRHGPSMVTYGSSADADVKGSFVESAPYMHFYVENGDLVYNIRTQLIGAYNFANAMTAAAVGLTFGVDGFQIKEALECYVPSNNRSQYKKTDSNQLILDCYNANPSSMKVAVDSFAAIRSDCKMAIIGGMRELGSESNKAHKELLEQLLSLHLDRLMLVGDEFEFVETKGLADVEWFATTEHLLQRLKKDPIIGATILVKGSNSNRLWTVEELL